jgi:RimJ/RimL family protein N-acetyltransferase
MHPPSPAPTLTGEGVTLRAHRPGDETDIIGQCRDPLTQRWTTVPVPYTDEHAREYIDDCRRGWEHGTSWSFAVEVSGRFAGSVSLLPRGAAALTLGYGLAPWARGRHVTSRALRVALRWAFATLTPEVVIWSAIAGNWASRRVAWRAGVRVEGTVRGLQEQRGIRLDGWIGSIRRGDPLAPAHPWFDPPVITGDGVALRPHATSDVAAMAQACNDPLTQHWLTQLPRPYTRDDARAHLEEIAEEHAAGRAIFWAIADPMTDRLLGEIGMWGMAQGESRSGELGYWTHPDARGRGLTTRAVRLASRQALTPRDRGGVGLTRLVIRAAAGNTASQRVAGGAGFRFTGSDRQAQLMREGTAVDLLRFDLLSTELAGSEAGTAALAEADGQRPGGERA